MKKDFVLLTIVMVFVVLLGVYFWMTPKAPELAYHPIEVDGGSITVEDQEQFDYVKLDAEIVEAGWITIHQTISVAQGAAAPADIVGTSDFLEPGSYEDLMINLSRSLNPGEKYTAILHVDDGDQQYVTEDDMPASVDGVVVRPDFIAIGPPSEGEEEDVEDVLEETEEEEVNDEE